MWYSYKIKLIFPFHAKLQRLIRLNNYIFKQFLTVFISKFRTLAFFCRFWQEQVDYTPESRIEVHKHMEKKRREKEQKDKGYKNTNKKPRKQFTTLELDQFY